MRRYHLRLAGDAIATHQGVFVFPGGHPFLFGVFLLGAQRARALPVEDACQAEHRLY